MQKKKAVVRVSSSFGQEDKSLAVYLKEISDSKPLTSKEEAELTVRIRNGDRDALDTLVKANLRFVVSVSKGYQNQGVPLVDLINEGNLGLIEAAKRFDERKNFRFISYAVWWIRQAILQLLAESSRIVRLPLNRVGCLHRIGLAERRLEQKLSRLPTTEEIAADLDECEQDVRKMMLVGNRHASLDAEDDQGKNLYNLISSEEEENLESKLSDSSLNKELEKMFARLDSREKEIIKLYFGIGCATSYTLGEIGIKYNITRERVRQIRQKALMKLQKPPINMDLYIFLQN